MCSATGSASRLRDRQAASPEQASRERIFERWYHGPHLPFIDTCRTECAGRQTTLVNSVIEHALAVCRAYTRFLRATSPTTLSTGGTSAPQSSRMYLARRLAQARSSHASNAARA